jgi:maleate isomerase
MTDVLGWRCKFGVITPSTNTVVQPEYDAMRPVGVTNHIGRMHIPDDPIRNDNDFNELIRRIDIALDQAVERVLTCKPDHMILGISAESIWGGGTAPSKRIAQRIRAQAPGIGITQAADALPAAFQALGVGHRIAMITPYFPVAGPHLQAFCEAIGVHIVRVKHFCCPSPVQIAHVTEDQLRGAIREVDGPDVEAIIQFGANLGMGRVAAEAENWIGKPVIAVNTATYWHALRSKGIADQKPGHGRLLAEF